MKINIKNSNIVYVLKRCTEDNLAYNDFVYGEVGSIVEAKDWEDNKECKNGLHGWTDGFDSYFDSSFAGNFVILEVDKTEGYVELSDKVKFRKGRVVYNSPDVMEAHKIMKSHYPNMILHWGVNRQANNSTNTQRNASANYQGNNSVNNQGRESINYQKDDSKNTQRNASANYQGNNSVNSQLDYSANYQGNYSANIQGGDSVNYQGNNSINIQKRYSVNTIWGDSHILKCKSSLHATVMFFNDKMVVLQGGKDYFAGETIRIQNFEIVNRYTTTPEKIDKLKEHEIIVFGSNSKGNHAGGLAKECKDRWGAIQGQATGEQGQCFAINTMEGLNEIKKGLEELVKFANKNTTKIIFLTKIGTGIVGYEEEEIIGLLPQLPANIIVPEGWDKY